jgi:hypothetical protein
MNELSQGPKDTSQSCIFDFPDRPGRPVPPIDPDNPPNPPLEYPYEPVLDWPPYPPVDPVPGQDPIPGSNPHPYLVPRQSFPFYTPYYKEHQNTVDDYVSESQFVRLEYWDVNSFPTAYTDGQTTLVFIGWNGPDQAAWVKGLVVPYPFNAATPTTPRAVMESIFLTETGHTYSEARVPANADDWQNGIVILTGVMLLQVFYNVSHGIPPNPATYDVYFFYYALYRNYSLTFDPNNPMTWDVVSLGACPSISLRAPVVGVTINTEAYGITQAEFGNSNHYRIVQEKTIIVPHMHVPNDTVVLGVNIGF